LTERRNVVLTNVSELINPDTNTWDEELVRSLFLPMDATRILNILLAVGYMADFIAWNHSKLGIFTVRSAYYTEWEYQHGGN
jgi:hypothetical protein